MTHLVRGQMSSARCENLGGTEFLGNFFDGILFIKLTHGQPRLSMLSILLKTSVRVFALRNLVAMAQSLKQLNSSHGRQLLKHQKSGKRKRHQQVYVDIQGWQGRACGYPLRVCAHQGQVSLDRAFSIWSMALETELVP